MSQSHIASCPLFVVHLSVHQHVWCISVMYTVRLHSFCHFLSQTRYSCRAVMPRPLQCYSCWFGSIDISAFAQSSACSRLNCSWPEATWYITLEELHWLSVVERSSATDVHWCSLSLDYFADLLMQPLNPFQVVSAIIYQLQSHCT